jgi:SH3-like domain-containing protein
MSSLPHRFRLACASATLGLLLSVGAARVDAAEYRSIGEDGTILYDAPSPRSKKLFVATRLYPVEVLVTIDNWVKVRDQAGDLGWVEKKLLSERRTVVVSAPAAAVRQSADQRAPLAFQAEQGVALDVADPPAGGWIKVRHSDGQTGFVRINQVWGL